MTIEAVKTSVKNVLEQAGALSAQDRIAGYWLEVAIRRLGPKNFDLPFSFGIVGVAVGINLRCKIIDVLLATRRILEIEQRGSSHSFRGLHQYLFRSFIQILHSLCALTNDFEMIVIIPAIKGQVETT